MAVNVSMLLIITGVTVDSVIDFTKLKKAYDKCVTTTLLRMLSQWTLIGRSHQSWEHLNSKHNMVKDISILSGGDMVEKVSIELFSKVNRKKGWYGDLNKWSPS